MVERSKAGPTSVTAADRKTPLSEPDLEEKVPLLLRRCFGQKKGQSALIEAARSVARLKDADKLMGVISYVSKD